MRVEARRRLIALPLLCALALTFAAGGCGGGGAPFRIGVIVDCVGLNRSLRDAELSGAELPLIARGAALRGRLAGSGVTATEVGGKTVELVQGCTELWEVQRAHRRGSAPDRARARRRDRRRRERRRRGGAARRRPPIPRGRLSPGRQRAPRGDPQRPAAEPVPLRRRPRAGRGRPRRLRLPEARMGGPPPSSSPTGTSAGEAGTLSSPNSAPSAARSSSSSRANSSRRTAGRSARSPATSMASPCSCRRSSNPGPCCAGWRPGTGIRPGTSSSAPRSPATRRCSGRRGGPSPASPAAPMPIRPASGPTCAPMRARSRACRPISPERTRHGLPGLGRGAARWDRSSGRALRDPAGGTVAPARRPSRGPVRLDSNRQAITSTTWSGSSRPGAGPRPRERADGPRCRPIDRRPPRSVDGAH